MLQVEGVLLEEGVEEGAHLREVVAVVVVRLREEGVEEVEEALLQEKKEEGEVVEVVVLHHQEEVVVEEESGLPRPEGVVEEEVVEGAGQELQMGGCLRYFHCCSP